MRPLADSGFQEGLTSNSLEEDGRAWSKSGRIGLVKREKHNGLRVRREGVRVDGLIYGGLEWAHGSDLSTISASSMFLEMFSTRCYMFLRKCIGAVLHIGWIHLKRGIVPGGVAQLVFMWTSHHALRWDDHLGESQEELKTKVSLRAVLVGTQESVAWFGQ
ncbi:hypothetical protein M9H77_19077 [Catharanthus roseus]|uniref:Uncharacterized protein n=1 Tax=Catharanthus roseus TaxID=4058 RepID=A0ACC0B9A5_CATRO|nr:hypothetical protein M9H77_19077 [Catharanthus roseus]